MCSSFNGRANPLMMLGERKEGEVEGGGEKEGKGGRRRGGRGREGGGGKGREGGH